MPTPRKNKVCAFLLTAYIAAFLVGFFYYNIYLIYTNTHLYLSGDVPLFNLCLHTQGFCLDCGLTETGRNNSSRRTAARQRGNCANRTHPHFSFVKHSSRCPTFAYATIKQLQMGRSLVRTHFRTLPEWLNGR